MRNFRIALPHFIALGLISLCITTVAAAQTAEQIAEKALAATVYLEMTDSNGQTLAFGSGFFVKGHQIATNYHVIAGAAKGTAKLIDKPTKYTIEGEIAVDEDNDLALIQIEGPRGQPLPLGDSDTVKTGQTVYVAGNPQGLEGTFSNGIISSLREIDAKKRLQMTAPISPGSSGGPVLNEKGQVIGVSFMAIEGGQNLNFAIPSNYLKRLLDRSGGVKPFSSSISAETYCNRGNKIYDLGLYQEAIAIYDTAIYLQPDFTEAYFNRGMAKQKLGLHVAAIADYDNAIRLQPDNANAYYNRGMVKSKLGQYFAAIADYDTAIRLQPDHADAYNNRGNAKSKLGQYAAAIIDYDTAIRLQPDNADAYNNRGAAKWELGQPAAAIADYDTAIRLQPDYANAYNNRGIAKSDLGQHDAAIADYDTAIRLQPDYAKVYLSRGLAKSDLGQHDAAIADYDTAIRLQPDYAKVYLSRGLAKHALNRTWSAKQDLQTALRLTKQTNDENLKAKIERALQSLD